jgi:hypothetical protein
MRLLRSLVLPAAVAVTVLFAAPLAAQSRVLRDAAVRATPDGTVIATLQTGTTWGTGNARSGFTQLTVEGWVDGSRFAGRRDSFPESIGGTGTLRIRADPSLGGRILGVFESGAGVRVLERRGTWARVRRAGWVLSSALAAAPAERNTSSPAASSPRQTGGAPAAAQPSAPAATQEPESAPRGASRPGALRATARLPLHNAPGTAALGSLDSGMVVVPLARDRGWVRIRVEAWVPDTLLVPTDSSYEAVLTAADLRLDPQAYVGSVVRWRVQVVALQNADPLRRALAPEEPYLLAMGPGGENAVLYIAVPPALMAQAQALKPLAEVVVTARIRNGRSEPTGAPVLDLISIVKR